MRIAKHLLAASLLAVALLLCACSKTDISNLEAEQAIVLQIPSRERAVNVTPAEAARLARLFENSYDGLGRMALKGGTRHSPKISSTATVREDGQPLMYIFNYEDGGFIIVGSTREYYPILAYSDKGSFILQDDMGPVEVWLDETKGCIKNSSSQSDEEKAQMRSLWSRFEDADLLAEKTRAARVLTKSTGEDYCWARIDSLQAMYGSEGWLFTTLSGAAEVFSDLGLSSYYTTICNSAIQNHSALNETIIGYQYIYEQIVSQVGPLIGTEWHQVFPFGSLCPNGIAGCGAVAAGQVMFFHQYPSSMTWEGEPFTWDDLPAAYFSVFRDLKHPQLMRLLGQKFQMDYSSDTISTTTVANVVSGLNSLGYSAYSANYDANSTETEIVTNGRPVIMRGKDSSDVPGHIWVCEGVRNALIGQLLFYTENQPYGVGSFTQGMYSHGSPGSEGGIVYRYYYMNWGWVSYGTIHYNGWFLPNDVSVNGHNLQNSRKNIYVSLNN